MHAYRENKRKKPRWGSSGDTTCLSVHETLLGEMLHVEIWTVKLWTSQVQSSNPLFMEP